jgi:hypothetical protein
VAEVSKYLIELEKNLARSSFIRGGGYVVPHARGRSRNLSQAGDHGEDDKRDDKAVFDRGHGAFVFDYSQDSACHFFGPCSGKTLVPGLQNQYLGLS